MKMDLAINNILQRYNFRREVVERGVRVGLNMLLVIFAAYIVASTLSAVFVGSLLRPLLRGERAPVTEESADAGGGLVLSQNVNYHKVRMAILDRNLFNSEGKIPDEKEGSAEGGEEPTQAFDISAPCRESRLPLKLIGTIYLGSPEASLAAVKEEGYSEVDVYRGGDRILGFEEATVIEVHRKRLVINNAGVKECFELKEDKRAVSYAGQNGDGTPSTASAGQPPAETGGSAGGMVVLDSSYVEAELGPGSANLINKARVVPNPLADGSINGFKIFAIDQASIFARIGLRNNDVITKVNEVSLKQADQGFLVYQAFEDSRDLTFHVEREGKPVTINVQIR